MEYGLKEFKVHGDETGSLIAIEALRDIPFEIRRVYYVFGTQANAIRGKHSHRKLEQIIFCPIGSCDFILDDGNSRQCIHMDRPNKGLYIKGNIWREFTNFSPDCVVMVLASFPYDDGDYIKSYNEFLAESKK